MWANTLRVVSDYGDRNLDEIETRSLNRVKVRKWVASVAHYIADITVYSPYSPSSCIFINLAYVLSLTNVILLYWNCDAIFPALNEKLVYFSLSCNIKRN